MVVATSGTGPQRTTIDLSASVVVPANKVTKRDSGAVDGSSSKNNNKTVENNYKRK